MNSPDKLNLPGLDALRSETAPARLQSEILRTLQPVRSRTRRLKVLKISLATVVAGALVVSGLLVPRASFAAAVAKVLKAFQSVRRYHVRTYQTSDGLQRLASETWVTDGSHKSLVYGPDGKPLPNSADIGETAAKIDKMLRGLTPKQLLDPALKDKLSKEVGALGPGSGAITSRITVDGHEVSFSDLPEGVKEQIMGGMAQASTMLSIGGDPDVTYLCGLLRDPEIWNIAQGQQLNGKTVDEYRIKGRGDDVRLFVDPKTSLPVSLQMKSNLFGQAITTVDDFEYPIAGT